MCVLYQLKCFLDTTAKGCNALTVGGSHSYTAVNGGGKTKAYELAILPGDIHRDIALCLQTLDRTGFEFCREGREQTDLVIFTLQQHQGDASAHTVVAVDLEGRMGIKQIGVGTAGTVVRFRVGVYGG